MRYLIAILLTICWTTAGSATVDLNAVAVEKWAENYFAKAMKEHRISGAILTVVRDGKIIVNSGYGYADYVKKTLIDPDTTQFRIGSNTKTFTATAIAQLMELGLIESLDDPANKYLKRDTLAKYQGQDITLRHLMTHSSGFAYRLYGLATHDDFELPLAAEQVQTQQTELVRAPGRRSVYSNYGTALLAIIVEDITGMKIADYFEQKIFKPLSMSNSILNMTPRATKDLAQPYAFFPNGEPQLIEHKGIHPFFSPTGAIIASGADMGRYMIAQLDAGKSGASPLGISTKGFSQLQSRIHGNHPDTAGFAMIFAVDEWADEIGFGHGGDWEGFHSWMWMWPESNTGIFFALLAEEPTVISTLEGIQGSDRLIPNEDNPVFPPLTNIGTLLAFEETFIGADTPPINDGRLNVDDLVGSYRGESRPYGTMMTFIMEIMFGGTVVEVEKNGSDELMIAGFGPYRQTAKGLFWSDDVKTEIDGEYGNTNIWTFSWDKAEQTYYLSPRMGGVSSHIKVGALSNPALYSALFGPGLLILLTGVIAIFWKVKDGITSVTKYAIIFTPILVILSIVVLMFGYPEGDTPALYLQRGEPGKFILSLLFANLAIITIVTQLVASVRVWRVPSEVSLIHRLHISLLGIGALAILIIFIFGNFYGFNLP